MSSNDTSHPLETACQPCEEGLRATETSTLVTPLLNQGGFLDMLHQEIDWVARSGESSLLLMLQPDHLDKPGLEPQPTQAVMGIAQTLCSNLRAQDHVGLINPQVFGVVLHDCQADEGLEVAQRLHQRVQDVRAPEITDGLTASMGAAFAPLWVRSEVSVWMSRALTQLLAAQSRGGNCLCVDSRYLSALSTHDAAQHYLSASTIEFRPSGLH